MSIIFFEARLRLVGYTTHDQLEKNSFEYIFVYSSVTSQYCFHFLFKSTCFMACIRFLTKNCFKDKMLIKNVCISSIQYTYFHNMCLGTNN